MPPAWFEQLVAPAVPAAEAGRAVIVQWWMTSLVVTVAAVVTVLVVGGLGLALVVLVAIVGGVTVAVTQARRREVRQVEAELPAVLETLAGSVRSGGSLPLALRDAAASAAGPLRVDLEQLLAGAEAGRSLVDELGAWSARRGSGRVRLTAAALTLGLQYGGSEARTLDGVAATLRDRLAVDRELVALSSQARMSALVMIAAPVVFVVLTGAGDASAWTFFVRTPVGFACLVLGLALDVVGGVWMWRISLSRS